MESINEYRELLIGCGASREKVIQFEDKLNWHTLTTLDIMKSHNPDVVWDLNMLPLPFDNNYFNEIHAYEVLEHCGQQGDYKFFFDQFADFWRILKPNGILCATVPTRDSIWAWGDPGHTRIISQASLVFLLQETYTQQVGNTTISDYRSIYTADFKILLSQVNRTQDQLRFVLQAIKSVECAKEP
jgi:hypothetical protein